MSNYIQKYIIYSISYLFIYYLMIETIVIMKEVVKEIQLVSFYWLTIFLVAVRIIFTRKSDLYQTPRRRSDSPIHCSTIKPICIYIYYISESGFLTKQATLTKFTRWLTCCNFLIVNIWMDFDNSSTIFIQSVVQLIVINTYTVRV